MLTVFNYSIGITLHTGPQNGSCFMGSAHLITDLLIDPDEDASTRMITDRDMAQIKRQSDRRDSMDEAMRLKRDNLRVYEEGTLIISTCFSDSSWTGVFSFSVSDPN